MPGPFRCSARGIALIACCLLIAAADENHRLAYESAKLKLDLEQIQEQVDVNGQFLHRVANDPSLLERLAQRQMKLVRQGTSVLELDHQSNGNDLSPFRLTTLPPPAELSPYRPIGGTFSTLCREPHTQLYLLGLGLLLVAIGLTMDYSEPAIRLTSD